MDTKGSKDKTSKAPNFLIRSRRELAFDNQTKTVDPKLDTGDVLTYFKVEPRVLKFKGFEIGKSNIKKFSIVNTSSVAQRLTILPMISDNFQFFFEKKGKIAPGMSEEVKVSFVPRNYNYYHTQVRILGEAENFIVPIHAFPVMNKGNVEIFPKRIDFGLREIGKVHTIQKPLICKIPVNFEFEFKLLNEIDEIKINPLKGIVPGESYVNIDITFTPKSSTTMVFEAEVS